MFSFQSVKSGWGQSLRGGRSLGAVLAKDRIGLVSDVVACPGHVALLLHASSLLCVFDAVPTDRQLTELEDRALTHALTHPTSVTAASSSSSVASEHSLRIQRVVLVSPHSSAPVINLWFEADATSTTANGGGGAVPTSAAAASAAALGSASAATATATAAATLRLFAVQADGWLHSWRWNAATWRWQPYAPVLLPPSRDPRSFGVGRAAPRRRITAVTASTPPTVSSSSSSSSASFAPPPSVTAGGRIIFWCETYTRDDATTAATTSTNSASKSDGEAKAATKGDTKPDATTDDKKRKKKEYMRLCWSELWFEEAAKTVSAAGPAKPPSYHAHDDDYDYDDDDGSAARVGKANLTDTLEGDIHGLFSSKEGAWLMTGGKDVEPSLREGGSNKRGVEAVAATLHSITGELILLGTSGEVLLCSVKEDGSDHARAEPTERSKQEADMKRKMSADRMDLSPSPATSTPPLQLRRLKSKLRIQPITTCQGLIKENQRGGNEVVDVFAHRHVVGVVSATSVRIFDLRRGLFLEEVPLPKPIILEGGLKRRFFPASSATVTGGLWRLGGLSIPAASVGVWGVDGLWTLQYPKVTKQAEFLIKAASSASSTASPSPASSSESPLRDAAMLCKDWGLDRWYTKYLFDQATHSREKIRGDENLQRDEQKAQPADDQPSTDAPQAPKPRQADAFELRLLKDSCTDLAPFLENPALIIGMLASASASNRSTINQQLGAFLAAVQPKSLDRTAVATNPNDKRAYALEFTESERDQQRKAFHYTTPLNRRIMPILQHYYQLTQKLNEQSNASAASSASAPLASLTSSSTPAVTLAKLTSSDQPVATARSSFSVSSPQSPADMRRANLAQVNSIDRLLLITRGDFELAEEECPDLLLDKLLQLFLPQFQDEVGKQQRSKTKKRTEMNSAAADRRATKRKAACKKNKQKSATDSLSPAHPTLLQSSAYGLSSTSMSSSLSTTPAAASDSAAKLKRAESFAPGRLNEGAGTGGDGEEEDMLASEDETKRGTGGSKKLRRGGNEHPFFATLCRLLYARRPSLLVPFFHLLTASDVSTLSPSSPTSTSSPAAASASIYLKRAFDALPPFPYHLYVAYAEQTPQIHQRSAETFDEQLEARVWLLCRIGQAPNALRLLLFLGLWEHAMRIMDKRVKAQLSDPSFDRYEQAEIGPLSEEERKQAKLEHFELFHVLLMHSIEKRDSDKLARCWEYLPQSFGVFDLLRSAKSSLTVPPLNPSYSTIFAADADHDAEGPSADDPSSKKPSEAEHQNVSSSSSNIVTTRKAFTVDDFRPQLIKMFYRMKAQQELKEKQRASQEELARQHEADAQSDRQRKELEELRRQERLIIERRAKEDEDDDNAPPNIFSKAATTTPSKSEAATMNRRPSAAGEATKATKQQTPTKKKENFISIFDIVGK